MLSQFDHKFLRKLLEASWIRVQLISPIGDLKHTWVGIRMKLFAGSASREIRRFLKSISA
jgi:hypothetical protein